MFSLTRTSDPSAFRMPVRLRIGAGALVLALHAAVAAFIVQGTHTAPIAAQNASAMMVSVIDAPAPQQAPVQRQPQPPASVAALPVAPPPESAPRIQADPPPESPPTVHPSPLAPLLKQKPTPQSKPRPKPESATRSASQETTPAALAPPVAGAPQGQQQASQAPRQDPPVLVTSIQYDGSRPIPVYPRLSRLHDETGRVVVLVRISAQGKVDGARIDTSSGHVRLDDAALDAARRARFKPFTRNGVALPALARLPYDFQMKD